MTTKQWNAFLAVLLQNMNPEALDADVLQRSVIGNPQFAGAEFTRFLQNGCRLNLSGLKIKPMPFNPVEFGGLSQGWVLVPEEHDSRNDGLDEVDLATADLVSSLNAGETSITGEEKLKRLKASGVIRHGANLFHALWLDYQAQRGNSVLEMLYGQKQVTYLDFLGDVLTAPGGRRRVLYLYRDGGRWDWHARWLDCGWLAVNLSLVSQVASDP